MTLVASSRSYHRRKVGAEKQLPLARKFSVFEREKIGNRRPGPIHEKRQTEKLEKRVAIEALTTSAGSAYWHFSCEPMQLPVAPSPQINPVLSGRGRHTSQHLGLSGGQQGIGGGTGVLND